MPDGTFQKVMDVSKIQNLGWKPEIDFEEGVRRVYVEKFLGEGS